MKFLKAEQQLTQYYFQVLLDEAQVQEDGTPNPAYVKEYTFLLTPPQDQTTAQYIAFMKLQIQALADYDLHQIVKAGESQTPTPLAGF